MQNIMHSFNAINSMRNTRNSIRFVSLSKWFQRY